MKTARLLFVLVLGLVTSQSFANEDKALPINGKSQESVMLFLPNKVTEEKKEEKMLSKIDGNKVPVRQAKMTVKSKIS
jgi:hypothetical protein